MDSKLDKWRALSARLAAEFGIVVLGVTIALWADGWVSDRDDRADEFRRLEALQDNVTDTLSGLDLAIEIAVTTAIRTGAPTAAYHISYLGSQYTQAAWNMVRLGAATTPIVVGSE